jgi:hypothetical protein
MSTASIMLATTALAAAGFGWLTALSARALQCAPAARSASPTV